MLKAVSGSSKRRHGRRKILTCLLMTVLLSGMALMKWSVGSDRASVNSFESKLPNIDYLASGYNIFFGNPHVTGAGIDPGFTIQPVFDLTDYSDKMVTADGEFLLPNGVSVLECPSCSFDSSFQSIYDSQTYFKSLSMSVSGEVCMSMLCTTPSYLD